MGRRSNIDWTAIRREHELGHESEKKIAERHGVSYSTYRMHRDEEGWQRDMSDAVRLATQAKLLQRAADRSQAARLATQAKQLQRAPEKDAAKASVRRELANVEHAAIDAAAAENVSVITRHRNVASELMRMAQGMGIELVEVSKGALNVDALLKMAAGVEAPTLLLDQFRDAVSLSRRLQTLEKLARTVSIIVNVERQAHGLDSSQTPPNAYEQALRELSQ